MLVVVFFISVIFGITAGDDIAWNRFPLRFVGNKLSIDLNVGTLPVNVTSWLNNQYPMPTDLHIIDKFYCGSGYSTQTSWSFKKSGGFDGNLVGTEVVNIGGDITYQQTNATLNVVESICDTTPAEVYFGNSRTDSFFRDLIMQQPKHFAVLVYIYYAGSWEVLHNASLTLGYWPTDLCKDYWAYVPASSDSSNEWLIQLKSFSIGNMTNAKPRVVRISIDSDIWEATTEQCTFLKTTIGLDDLGSVSCNQKNTINFNFGSTDLQFSAYSYVRLSASVGNGRCLAKIRCGAKTSTLPRTVIYSKCTLYDFENDQIGFAGVKN